MKLSKIFVGENKVKLTIKSVLMSIGLPLWVLFSYILATALATILTPPFFSMAVYSNLIYLLISIVTLLIMIGLPRIIAKKKISKNDLGLSGPFTLKNILVIPVGLIFSYILMTGMMMLAPYVIPGFDANQPQAGYGKLTQFYEYILVFVLVVVLAPIFEELICRGYLYGKLKQYAPIWLAILITSVTFGLLHMTWNVGISAFASSIVMCLLCNYTGNIKSSILLHATSNGIAYFVIFILPLISVTIK